MQATLLSVPVPSPSIMPFSIAFDHVSDDSRCAFSDDSTDIRHDTTRPRKDILPGITRPVVQLYPRVILIRSAQRFRADLKGHLRLITPSHITPSFFYSDHYSRHFSRMFVRLGTVLPVIKQLRNALISKYIVKMKSRSETPEFEIMERRGPSYAVTSRSNNPIFNKLKINR